MCFSSYPNFAWFFITCIIYISSYHCLELEIKEVYSDGRLDCSQISLYKHLKDVPLYFINLDSAIDRRNRFLIQYECMKLRRIAGVNASDEVILNSLLKNDISTLPGTIDSLADGIWNGKTFIQQNRTQSQAFIGALGCTLAHLKTALAIFRAGHEYALVLEDDASPELAYMWFGSIEGWIHSLDSSWSALQLSAIGSLFFWSARFEVAEKYESRQVIFQDGW